MHKTRNDLPEKSRRKLIDLLNARLADAIDLRAQAKHAHWNVKGPHFIALHELFDKVVAELDDPIDDMAERVAALGGFAEGRIGQVAKASALKPYPNSLVAGADHVDALADALAAFGKHVRKAIDEAAKLGDADTSDLFTGISRTADKTLWLVEAHQQADR